MDGIVRPTQRMIRFAYCCCCCSLGMLFLCCKSTYSSFCIMTCGSTKERCLYHMYVCMRTGSLQRICGTRFSGWVYKKNCGGIPKTGTTAELLGRRVRSCDISPVLLFFPPRGVCACRPQKILLPPVRRSEQHNEGSFFSTKAKLCC